MSNQYSEIEFRDLDRIVREAFRIAQSEMYSVESSTEDNDAESCEIKALFRSLIDCSGFLRVDESYLGLVVMADTASISDDIEDFMSGLGEDGNSWKLPTLILEQAPIQASICYAKEAVARFAKSYKLCNPDVSPNIAREHIADAFCDCDILGDEAVYEVFDKVIE